jgi:hypothetical protein
MPRPWPARQALEQHMAVTLQGYAEDLDNAHANALSAQSLLPDVQRASERFARSRRRRARIRRADRHHRLGQRRAIADPDERTQMNGAGLATITGSPRPTWRPSSNTARRGWRPCASWSRRRAPSSRAPIAFQAEAVQLDGRHRGAAADRMSPPRSSAPRPISAAGFIAPVADGLTRSTWSTGRTR